jgi:hypothetical protein
MHRCRSVTLSSIRRKLESKLGYAEKELEEETAKLLIKKIAEETTGKHNLQ